MEEEESKIRPHPTTPFPSSSSSPPPGLSWIHHHLDILRTIKVVVYHSPCSDGATSKALIKRQMEIMSINTSEIQWVEGNFSAVTENTLPFKITGPVMLLDFAYKRDIMDYILSQAGQCIVIDHHETNIKALETWQGTKFFDMLHSGAGLTWQWLYGLSTPPPKFVNLVEDRDLFNHKFVESNLLSIFLMTRDTLTDELITGLCFDEKQLERALVVGKHMEEMKQHQISRSVNHTRIMIWKGMFYGIVNETTWVSDVGAAILERYPQLSFAVMYIPGGGKTIMSLRSRKAGDNSSLQVNVAEICRQFEGGGHPSAAGCSIPNLVDRLPGSKDGKGVWKVVSNAVVCPCSNTVRINFNPGMCSKDDYETLQKMAMVYHGPAKKVEIWHT